MFWCWRIAARSSAQTSEKLRDAWDRARHHPGRHFRRVRSSACRSQRSRPCTGAPSARGDGFAAGRSAGRSTKATTRRPDLPEDHRRLSGRNAARPDGNAVPRRRSRARRHLRDHDRMPAGRGADRAAAISSVRASTRRSIPISTASARAPATTTKASLPSAWTGRS